MILPVVAVVATICLALAGLRLNPPAAEDRRYLALRLLAAFVVIGAILSLASCATVKTLADACRAGLCR